MSNREFAALRSVFQPWDLGFKPACTLEHVASELGLSRPMIQRLELRGLLLMAIELHARGFSTFDELCDRMETDHHRCRVEHAGDPSG